MAKFLKLGNFVGDNGKPYLVRCPMCESENYAASVASGACYACGWNANKSLKVK